MARRTEQDATKAAGRRGGASPKGRVRPQRRATAKKVGHRTPVGPKDKLGRRGRAVGRSSRRQTLSGLEKGDGCAAFVRVAERVGRDWDEEDRVFTLNVGPVAAVGRGLVGRHIQVLRGLCRVFAAAGHLQRSKVLLKLVEGPATYQTLRKLTGLKAGPLYHHVNQLRLAGLVLPKQRDLYELTRAGRNLIVGGLALEPFTRDARRRPVSRS